MIKIDPTSLKGLEELQETLHGAMDTISKKATVELSNLIEENIRTGYDKAPFGSSDVWDWISPEREEQLDKAQLMPHEGLVAETEQLVNSLQVMESFTGEGYIVTVTQWYAVEHEYGSIVMNAKGETVKTLPARPFFWPAVLYFKTEDIPKKVVNEVLKEIIK
jgi:hypothetical protein